MSYTHKYTSELREMTDINIKISKQIFRDISRGKFASGLASIDTVRPICLHFHEFIAYIQQFSTHTDNTGTIFTGKIEGQGKNTIVRLLS